MPRHISFPSTLARLTHSIVILLSSILSCHTIHAQTFQPIPVGGSCSAFVEGQGLYVFGGSYANNLGVHQAFMVDLSVSWNASNPVFKQLTDGPGALTAACTMQPNQEDIFMVVLGVGYIFNIKSNSWKFHINNKLSIGYGLSAATDPETGLVYVPNGSRDPVSNGFQLLAMDLKAKSFTTSLMPPLNMSGLSTSAWSPPLQSMLVISAFNEVLYTFTPSKVSKSSNGWGTLKTTGDVLLGGGYPCFFPAYNGSKMILFTADLERSAVYILDVGTLTWKKSPFIPPVMSSACALSGDQVIVWSGSHDGGKTMSKETLIYNLKTETWTSNYVAPPRPTTTLQSSPTSAQQVPGATTTPSPDSSEDTKLVVIIVVVTGVLMVMILTAIFVYIRRTKRTRSEGPRTCPDGSSTDSLNTVVHVDIDGKVPTEAMPRDPACGGPKSAGVSWNMFSGQKGHMSAKEGRLHLGFAGTRPDPENPHATVDEPTKARDVQVGTFGARPASQHPHASREEVPIANDNDKEESCHA